LARAIVVGLVVQAREKLQDIFRNNITNEELKKINKNRQCKSRINEGVIGDNEKSYLIDGRKLQEVLANTLHRICNIPVKQTGNDFQDVKLFEEKLDIEIQIYNFECRQIYKGIKNRIKIYILMSERHFDVISIITAFTCSNEDRHKAEYRKCKACKNETKCNIEEFQVSCIKCCKYFYGESCFNNHMENKKCIEHSYMCKKCYCKNNNCQEKYYQMLRKK